MNEVTNATQAPAEADAAAEVKTTKSIVPSKYAGRYKNGGTDALAEFIKTQCTSENTFSFDKFFDLCKKNGLDAAKVDHYAGQVTEKRHGAQGRARMTLRNMLATIARKNGKLVDLEGNEQDVSLPKVALTGAAKAAQEAASEKSEQTAAA